MTQSDKNSINRLSLKAMERRISLYENNKITLSQLTQDLISTVSGMLDLSLGWQKKFMDIWGTIEQVNAFALDEGCHEPLERHRDILKRALEELRRIIVDELPE